MAATRIPYEFETEFGLSLTTSRDVSLADPTKFTNLTLDVNISIGKKFKTLRSITGLADGVWISLEKEEKSKFLVVEDKADAYEAKASHSMVLGDTGMGSRIAPSPNGDI